VDGLLQEFEVLPRNLYSQLVCRVKILSNLDIAEKRLPQDGAISYTFNHEPVEFRVSTLPGVHGENIVLRILDPHSLPPDLKEIGFSGSLLASYDRMVRKPYGIILVTGPTGSGKTTTLYSTLSLVNQETSNIITIEDPVEYRRDGIHQIQINTKAGMTFSGALRSILRQDPDVIMVGEMRDSETAQIAIRAALTGHLVFSTLHTNDSPSSFIRLIDMGVAPYLVTSSILGILAQRLVRKICSHCKAPYQTNDEERAYLTYKLKQYGITADLASLSFYHGSGCPKCRGRGYRGRTASFEFIAMDSSVSQAILAGKGQEAIAKAALEQGYRALWCDAWDKVLQGITSVEEVMRVIN
jgi:type II secretory ATPase GspE/PulE/Tfp pilus assembly ATPase PilB-like protein